MDAVHVMIVGRSDVTCVVVARIVERSGFRPTCAKPEEAEELLGELQPDIVVLDGGADNRDCTGLLESIFAARASSGRPAVLLLSNRHEVPEGWSGVDAVIAKPITPERVGPVILRLAGEAFPARGTQS